MRMSCKTVCLITRRNNPKTAQVFVSFIELKAVRC